ncbi:MAG: hypothetical protein F6K30_22565 [Cyanothece sp. SIO2G6]|nr:hypothetical protein [Cyanothece sp. SIO2G6]
MTDPTTAASFLTIDNQPISIAQAVRYLQMGRKFDGFIGEILRQFVLEREIGKRDDIQVSPAVIEQAMVDFRLQNKLTDPQKFQGICTPV